MSTPSSEQQSKQLQFQELLLERTKALAAAAAQQQSEKTNSIDGEFFVYFRLNYNTNFTLTIFDRPHIEPVITYNN